MDSTVVSIVASTVALAVALCIVIFELSLLWLPLVLLVAVGAAVVVQKVGKRS